MSLPKIRPLLIDTYLATIKNSVGAETWRNFYAAVGRQRIDIMKNGDLSCAFFISSILTIFGLIKKIHGTVSGTIIDLEKSGWRRVKKLSAGAVIVWEARSNKTGESHRHIGFYLGANKAISNNSQTGRITLHHFTFGVKNRRPVRAIEVVYTHKKLN